MRSFANGIRTTRIDLPHQISPGSIVSLWTSGGPEMVRAVLDEYLRRPASGREFLPAKRRCLSCGAVYEDFRSHDVFPISDAARARCLVRRHARTSTSAFKPRKKSRDSRMNFRVMRPRRGCIENDARAYMRRPSSMDSRHVSPSRKIGFPPLNVRPRSRGHARRACYRSTMRTVTIACALLSAIAFVGVARSIAANPSATCEGADGAYRDAFVAVKKSGGW